VRRDAPGPERRQAGAAGQPPHPGAPTRGGPGAVPAARGEHHAPSSWLKQQIPIRTFADWDDARRGSVRSISVAYCGSSTKGFYLYTMCAADVATSWVELHALWGKGHYRVAAGVQAMRTRWPVPLAGLDSDNVLTAST